MTTKLSVNLNKIALLRNSRGRDYPSVVGFAKKFIALGAHGITVHPREDERHITRQDARDLAKLLEEYPEVEYNIEGYPSEEFLTLVEECNPDQVTLVPDAVDQLTSDHGWDVAWHGELLIMVTERLKKSGIRVAAFLDPDVEQVTRVAATGVDRIELYTEEFASSYGTPQQAEVLAKYVAAAAQAEHMELEINAGHDLDSENLPTFLTIPNILEVSIGHVLTVECIEQGMESVVAKYLDICSASA
ncbi:pyridoxine 5'-phosphate synthase [Leucothrix arctica]|uniref:Pyridoxine 5'-phosphate synthase n=1 Tax=Leucothrix arctica TaxID=1481894 RepID=A0A317C748_9GAMM|nr:pyridoxine 5'-phosphate synthase [Leucothrix arctica]PWQ94466.1 pyridoxine 5'-phosphate synthase [Leucothrix arctica]